MLVEVIFGPQEHLKTMILFLMNGEYLNGILVSDADFSIDGQCKSGHSNVHLVPVQKSSSPTNISSTTKNQTIPKENLISEMVNKSFSDIFGL